MSEILRIAVCEDEIGQRDKLIRLLEESDIENTYCTFSSGEELLAEFEPGKYDLILMDIYMDGELSGVETMQRIRTRDKEISLSFVTTSKDHALESYRLSAIKYIEKPYSKENIEETLHLAVLKKNDAPALFVHRNGETERVPFAEILYMEQQMHKVFLCLKTRRVFPCTANCSN